MHHTEKYALSHSFTTSVTVTTVVELEFLGQLRIVKSKRPATGQCVTQSYLLTLNIIRTVKLI